MNPMTFLRGKFFEYARTESACRPEDSTPIADDELIAPRVMASYRWLEFVSRFPE